MDSNPGISIFQSGGINIESPVQNAEEDEDLEEQKKRQEEIHNFLTTAMDEFNYDDQSTINSSTNISVDDTYNNQSNILQKYKNADLDDQIKVLYEIRVKEVKSLNEQLESLKMEIEKQRKINGKTSILLEAEKDKSKISSQQSQILLVNKSEEISKLKNEIDILRGTVMSLETTVKAVNDEYTLCKHANKELMDQLTLMHNGLTTNTISDRQLQEQHHSEVTQLHHMLDSAHSTLYRKEKECKELEQKLKESLSDKDVMLSEKCGLINQLTQNLENAQERCRGFSEIIDKLSQENKTLKLSTNSDLTESIRITGLSEKTDIIRSLQKEMDRSREIQHKQNSDLNSLQTLCEKLSVECKKYKIENDEYKNELDLLKQKCVNSSENLTKSNEETQKVQLELQEHKMQAATECKVYENKIKFLEDLLQKYENRQNEDRSVQVSNFADSYCEEKEENQNLKSEINTLHDKLETLTLKLAEAENSVSEMKLTVSLETEREALIKTLQEKAAKFENIIRQKQAKPESSSIATNTDTNVRENEEFLKTKFETDLVQREIAIRTEVKKDFDAKMEKVQVELSKRVQQLQERNCGNCRDLSNNLGQLKNLTELRDDEIGRLKLQMQQDREAVATLFEEWGKKFLLIESEKKELHERCNELKKTCDVLLGKLQTRDAGDSKLYEMIKQECEETIKTWNKNTVENIRRYTVSQQQTIEQSNRRIEEFSKNVDKEVRAIETQFFKKKQSIEHISAKTHRLKH